MSGDVNSLKKSLALVAMSACFSMLLLNESGAMAAIGIFAIIAFLFTLIFIKKRP